jgi:hypothetical protein
LAKNKAIEQKREKRGAPYIRIYDPSYRKAQEEENIIIEIEHDYCSASPQEVKRSRFNDVDFLESLKKILCFWLNEETEEKEAKSWEYFETQKKLLK